MSFGNNKKHNDDRSSYALVSDKDFVYTSWKTELKAYNWESGNLSLLNSRMTGGDVATHMSFDPDQSHLAVANFGTGDFVVYSLDPETGEINNDAQRRTRNANANAHWVGWDKTGDKVYVVYRGGNDVRRYDFDKQSGTLAENFTVAFSGQNGDGLRHMAFHPTSDKAYILTETSSALIATRVLPNGNLEQIQRFSTLPNNFNRENKAAHILINKEGTVLYISNRGHDSIVAYSIDDEGKLTLIERETQNVATPRVIYLMNGHGILFSANQTANSVSAFGVGLAGELDFKARSKSITNAKFVMPLP